MMRRDLMVSMRVVMLPIYMPESDRLVPEPSPRNMQLLVKSRLHDHSLKAQILYGMSKPALRIPKLLRTLLIFLKRDNVIDHMLRNPEEGLGSHQEPGRPDLPLQRRPGAHNIPIP